MKKFLSLLLCITILISSVNIAFAAESTQDTYNTIMVEFSDNIGESETLQVMINDENVYADVEELATRLGYDVNISDEYVSVYNKALSKTVPYGLTVFYYDSTKVEHMLFNHMTEYEAPFKTIKNESGVWIPLEYSLLLLNSGMMIVENTVLIDMPSKNIIDIYTDILKNNQNYLFDWQDIGISQENEDIKGEASFLVTMFNGLLTMDGASWVQFVQSFALDTSAYDFKYAEKLAMLFCTYSDDELEQEVNLIKSTMSYFTGDGALGKTINLINAEMSNNIEDLLKTSNELKEKLDKNNNASVVAYNKSYQALKNACDDAKEFSDATEFYTSVTKEISEATGFLDKFYKAAEVLGFASEFQNQDKFSVATLSEFVGNTDSQSVMSNAMKVGIKSYAGVLQTNVAAYSALRYLEEHYDDWMVSASKLVSSLGSPAQLMLIGWDVMSNYIPFYKEGLANADSFMVSMYANIFQADAFIAYQQLRNSIFSDVNEITPENLYKVSQYCYTYLKLCYINRNAALGALKEKTKEELPYLEEYLNSVNKEIAGYLIQLKNADTNNEEKCYGFLPQDNKKYLEEYDNKTFLTKFNKAYVPIVSDAYSAVVYDDSLSENYYYHIPQIKLRKNITSEVNEKIYKELKGILDDEVYSYINIGSHASLSEMQYDFGEKDNMVSIIVKTMEMHMYNPQYYVYNISSENGKELSVDELVGGYNMSIDAFYDLVKGTIKKYWDAQQSGLLNSGFSKTEYDKLVQRSLEDENIKAAVPYINSKGELCVVVYIYSPAGAGGYSHILNTTNALEEEWN